MRYAHYLTIPPDSVQAAKAVERRSFIALGERRVVEDGVDEVIDGAAKDHDRLADVDQFAGAFADDVDADKPCACRGGR